MSESISTKTGIYAPWNKKVLIPLWVIQFGFVLVELGWSLFFLILIVQARSDSGASTFETVTVAINAPLHGILAVIIINTFMSFSRFKLTTHLFRQQSFVAVAIGIIGTVFSFAGEYDKKEDNGGDIMGGIWCAIHLVASIALMGYVILVRRAVLKGHKMEMSCSGGETSSTVEINVVGKSSV